MLREVCGRSDFDDFLMPSLDRTVTLEEMYDVALGISKNLDLNMAWTLQEALDKANADFASLTALLKAFLNSDFSRTTRIPRPPPPMAALMMTR